MKQLTTEEKKVCRDIDGEINQITSQIIGLYKEISDLHNDLAFLKEKKEALLCPEDTSPEAIEQNQKLLEIVHQEHHGRRNIS